jgi:actin-related protein
MIKFIKPKGFNPNETFKKKIEEKIEYDLNTAMLDVIADGITDPIKIASFIKNTIVNINKRIKLDINAQKGGISKQETDIINEVTQKILRKYLEMMM